MTEDQAKERASNALPAFWKHVSAAFEASERFDRSDPRECDSKSRLEFEEACRAQALEALALIRYVSRYESELEIELLRDIDDH